VLACYLFINIPCLPLKKTSRCGRELVVSYRAGRYENALNLLSAAKSNKIISQNVKLCFYYESIMFTIKGAGLRIKDLEALHQKVI